MGLKNSCITFWIIWLAKAWAVGRMTGIRNLSYGTSVLLARFFRGGLHATARIVSVNSFDQNAWSVLLVNDSKYRCRKSLLLYDWMIPLYFTIMCRWASNSLTVWFSCVVERRIFIQSMRIVIYLQNLPIVYHCNKYVTCTMTFSYVTMDPSPPFSQSQKRRSSLLTLYIVYFALYCQARVACHAQKPWKGKTSAQFWFKMFLFSISSTCARSEVAGVQKWCYRTYSKIQFGMASPLSRTRKIIRHALVCLYKNKSFLNP